MEKRHIIVEFICTGEQRAHILTNTLARVKFVYMQELVRTKNLEQIQAYWEDVSQ